MLICRAVKEDENAWLGLKRLNQLVCQWLVLSSDCFTFFFFKPGDMEVCHLVQQISELIEFLPQLKPTFNLETEIGLAIQPLRSECSQLRRYDLFHFHCHVHFSTTQLTILTQSRTGN